MRARIPALLVFVLVAIFAVSVSACGGDDEKKSSGGSSSSGGGGDADVPKEVQEQAAENCKKSVSGAPQLSADLKADLEKICEEAAAGDEDDVRQATKEVCTKIVEETAPAGPARDQALMACDQATAAP